MPSRPTSPQFTKWVVTLEAKSLPSACTSLLPLFPQKFEKSPNLRERNVRRMGERAQRYLKVRAVKVHTEYTVTVVLTKYLNEIVRKRLLDEIDLISSRVVETG